MAGSSRENSSLATAAAVLATVVGVTAVATYKLTKRSEEKKHQALVWKQYERQKLLKAKTAKAREAVHEPPSGLLLEDVKIDRVYLWECQDLRKNFPSSNVENSMQCLYPIRKTAVRSPYLRTSTSSENLEKRETMSHHRTNYNHLVTDHECIIGEIRRKPNMVTHSVAYMRAGPRLHLHFDPKDVNAAIVTCGGL